MKKRFLLSGWALLFAALLPSAAQADGDLDPGFAPRIVKAGLVKTMTVQADGKILIGGIFTLVNGGQRRGLARLNADGSLDESFNPPVNISFRIGGDGVSAIALQPDGRILTAGSFSDDTSGVIRLNSDGSLDQTFQAVLGGDIAGNRFVMQPDGKFLSAAGTGAIARRNADGSADASFVYGGPTLGAGMIFSHSMLVQPDGKILYSANVTNPIGTTLNIFLRLNSNGSLDPSFKPQDFGIRSAGLKAVQPDSRILISRQTLERLNADGSPDPSFAPALSGTANSLLLQPDGRMVLDGGSTNLDGTRRNYLVRLNADGSLDASFTPGVMTNRLSFALAGLPDGGILAGGNFYQANDEIHVGLARFNSAGRLDSGFKPIVAGRTIVQYASLSPGGRVVIAGEFELVNETPRWKLARLNADGTLDNSFVPPPDLTVTNSVVASEDEYHRLAVQRDGKVLVYSRRASRFLRLNADGSRDASFTPPQLNGFLVNGVIALQPDGKILLPDTTASIPRVWFVRLHPDGTEDTSFKAPADLSNFGSLAVRPDGKILATGIAADRKAVIFLFNTDGTLSATFEVSAGEGITSIGMLALQPDGKMLVGGNVGNGSIGIDATEQGFVLRLNANGSVDTSFTLTLLGPVRGNDDFFSPRALTLQADGRALLARGNRILRLNPNGGLDTSFKFAVNAPSGLVSESIRLLLLQSDTQLLAGGTFDRVESPNSALRQSLAGIRLGAASIATTVSAASFAPAIAPDSIASVFGTGLAGSISIAATQPLPTTLDGVTVKIKDSASVERNALLFFISPGQINFQVPSATAPGAATATIELNGGTLGAGAVNVAVVAPGFFTFNGNGRGVPAGYALRVRGGAQTREAIHQPGAANQFEPRPIDLGLPDDQVWLVLFGTGIRGRTALSNVMAAIGGVNALVGYAGAQGDFAGLDQVNLLVPRSLIGRGEVDVVLIVDGQTARSVKINLK
jgi:uncharacterized protein (TIGR03437 family)